MLSHEGMASMHCRVSAGVHKCVTEVCLTSRFFLRTIHIASFRGGRSDGLRRAALHFNACTMFVMVLATAERTGSKFCAGARPMFVQAPERAERTVGVALVPL